VAFHTWLASRLTDRRPAFVLTQHLAIQAPLDIAVSTREKLRLHAMKRMLAFAAVRADACVGVSTPLAAELVMLGARPDRVHTIHNPVIGPDVQRRLSEQVAWPWGDETKPTLAFCGRLAAVKRPDLLLDAFARSRSHVGARLLVIGDGPLLPALIREVQARGLNDCVRCIGYVADPLPFLARCCALALTSDVEGFGNVIVEALAAGLSVVSTDCPSGPSEILMRGQYGILVPTGDPQRLAEGFVTALTGMGPSTPAERRRRAAQFGEEIAVGRYAALIGRLRKH
jgi:glycosyltransferase involved in cell wall biosynthesis